MQNSRVCILKTWAIKAVASQKFLGPRVCHRSNLACHTRLYCHTLPSASSWINVLINRGVAVSNTASRQTYRSTFVERLKLARLLFLALLDVDDGLGLPSPLLGRCLVPSTYKQLTKTLSVTLATTAAASEEETDRSRMLSASWLFWLLCLVNTLTYLLTYNRHSGQIHTCRMSIMSNYLSKRTMFSCKLSQNGGWSAANSSATTSSACMP